MILPNVRVSVIERLLMLFLRRVIGLVIDPRVSLVLLEVTIRIVVLHLS